MAVASSFSGCSPASSASSSAIAPLAFSYDRAPFTASYKRFASVSATLPQPFVSAPVTGSVIADPLARETTWWALEQGD